MDKKIVLYLRWLYTKPKHFRRVLGVAFSKPTEQLIKIYLRIKKLARENVKQPENCIQSFDVRGNVWDFIYLETI